MGKLHFEFDLSWLLVWLTLPLASYLLCRFLITHAARLGMLDPPTGRSSHSAPIPRLGGLGFVPVFGVYAFWVLAQVQTNSGGAAIQGTILLAMGGLFVLGVLDDYRDVPAKVRLLAQSFLVVVSLWVLSPALEALQITLWPLLAVLLALAAVWWVNLFNFMDGADGFAGSQALIMLGAGSLAVGLVGDYAPGFAGGYSEFNRNFFNTYLALSAGLFLILLGFLVLNWSPARVFMGDSGSTALAFYLFFSSLLVCLNDWRFTGFFLCLSAYFVSDATVTLLARIARGANVFKPHREHAYQVLLDRLGGSHARLTLSLLGWNLLVLLPFGVWSLYASTHTAMPATSLARFEAWWALLLPVALAYLTSVACVCWVRANCARQKS